MASYELLWDCFMSDQMTYQQLEQHMAEDSNFKVWVENRVKEENKNSTSTQK